MGNTESTEKKQPKKAVPRGRGEPSEGKLLIKTKRILLLHNSNSVQLKVLNHFRDALTAKTEGTIDVSNFVNIASGNEIPKSQAWLDERNNVVLICLTSESIEQFQRIILENGFADQNGRLHPKVFTFTFGESLSPMWPPKGLKKGSTDLRDFYFGFSDVENIRPEQIEGSLRLSSLIAAIKLTS